jgi:hypothetical protein
MFCDAESAVVRRIIEIMDQNENPAEHTDPPL